MKKIMLFVGLCVAFVGVAVSDDKTTTEMSYDKVYNYIVRAGLRGWIAECPFPRLLGRCNNDSNRLCRVACDVFRTHSDMCVQNAALRILLDYGDAQQIPFLESCVTNVWHGRTAIRILNRIEGFSSNSVARVARFHAAATRELAAVDPGVHSEKSGAIDDMALVASRPSVGTDLKNFVVDYVYTVASNDCSHIWPADNALMKIDPTFRNSKRRLALLRYVQPRASGRFCPQYLADEIQKLESYPEASLPE